MILISQAVKNKMIGEGLDGDVLDDPEAPADAGGAKSVDVHEKESGSSGDESDGDGWD